MDIQKTWGGHMKIYLRKNWILIFAFFVCSSLTGAVGVITYQTYSMVTTIAESKNLWEGFKVGIFVLIIVCILLFLDTLNAFLKKQVLYSISKKIKDDVMDKIFTTDLSHIKQLKKSNLVSILIYDIERLETEYYSNFLSLFSSMATLLLMLFAIYLVGINYFIVVILFCIPSIIQPFILKKHISRAGMNTSSEMAVFSNKLNEYIYGIDTIKTANKSEIFINKLSKDVDVLEKNRYIEQKFLFLNNTFILFSGYILKIGSMMYFVNQTLAGAISIATATLLFGYSNSVGNPISEILSYLATIRSTKEIQSKVETFLSLEPDIEKENIKSFEHSIVMKNISFSYSNKCVLNEVSFEFLKNKKYALFGKSGSGKSTLLKLLLSYENDYTGQILIDNKDIREINKSSLWDNIAYIQQKVFIMNGTLKDNITLFNNNISDDRVLEAIRLSGLSELVERLPKGIEEEIKEGGSNFSGGEKQRISIARALASNRDILIVDEGFSALDNINAAEIENMLLHLNKTIISITHRISKNIENYDEVLLLQDGRIVESGSFHELMEMNGQLKNLIYHNTSEVN